MISVITKSGGNEFHGDVFGYWDSTSLQASLKSAPADGAVSGTFQTVDYTRYDVGVDLGGYIVKDKLWFFAAYDFVSNENNNEVLKSAPVEGAPAEGDVLAQTTESDLWAAKLTWRIAANHSLSGSGFGDPSTQTGPLPGIGLAATPLHYMGDIETGGTNYSFNYDGIFGQNVVLSARAAQHNEKSLQTGPGATVVGYIDQTNPLGDGTTVYGWSADSNANTRVAGFGFFQNQEFSRDQYNVDLSWFVGNFAGSHEFKGGYEYEDIGVKNDNWNGGAGSADLPLQLRSFRHPRLPGQRLLLQPPDLPQLGGSRCDRVDDRRHPGAPDRRHQGDQRRLVRSGHLAGDQQSVAGARCAFQHAAALQRRR